LNRGDIGEATCRRFGIARSTLYLGREQHRKSGDPGLIKRYSAPHNHPNKTPDQVVWVGSGDEEGIRVLEQIQRGPNERYGFKDAIRPATGAEPCLEARAVMVEISISRKNGLNESGVRVRIENLADKVCRRLGGTAS
jgi:hypothetical protein